MNLSDLAAKYKTDKCDKHHTTFGRSNCDIYERLFKSSRSGIKSVLEIGVYRASSLVMWLEYFRRAKIYGLDIDPRAGGLCSKIDRIKIFVGSQDDPVVLQQIVDAAGGFDIIIDDGSHVNELTAASLDFLLPHVRPGGWYVIEDLKGSYVDMTDQVGRWPGMQYNRKGLSYKNDRSILDTRFHQMIAVMDQQEGDIASVQFYPMMVAIEKGA